MFAAELAGLDEETRPISLEFANTVRWHASQRPEETLRCYPDLVAWARKVGLTTEREAGRLLSRAQAQPGAAGRSLEKARRLREAIYRIFIAVIEDTPVRDADLQELNTIIRKMGEGAQIEHNRDGFSWSWNTEQGKLDGFLGLIALSAANLLLSDERRRIGQCADDRGCGWLFLDTSKNHSRRWCDMNDCGNRAKQRRLQQRRQHKS